MDVGDIIAASWLVLAFGLVALIMWAKTVVEWQELRQPPRPHDPVQCFTRGQLPWAAGPQPVHRRLIGEYSPDPKRPRVPVAVATVEAVAGGESHDEDGATVGAVVLRLPDGERTTIRTELTSSAVDVVQPGTFVPVRPIGAGRSDAHRDTWTTAWELSAVEVGRVLLMHRHALGLIDEADLQALEQRLGSTPEGGRLIAIRLTGSVRAGHVEVEFDVEAHGRPHTVRGFLRPGNIAAARHTRQVPLTRSTEGRWVLWPPWY